MAKELGTLYLIPNTLGELERENQLPWVLPVEVRQLAATLEYWIVENAKSARAFLKAVNQLHPLKYPLQSLHMQEWRGPNSPVTPANLITPLLEGHSVGLISEAGLPAVADPGTEIVATAHAAGIFVRPLTGPSSLMLALMASGLSGQHFSFHGYLPIKLPEKLKKIQQLEIDSLKNKSAQLWIETPYRNRDMLQTLLESCKNPTRLCVAIDLSLPSEQILSKRISEWKQFLTHSKNVLGELDKRPAVFLLQA